MGAFVAHAALARSDGWLVEYGSSQNASRLMAIETAAFENKPAAPIQAVALGAWHVRNRRMLMKQLKAGGRIRTDKEAHFLSSSLPQQGQRARARWNFECRVKYIRKGPFGLNGGYRPVAVFPKARWPRHQSARLAKDEVIRRPENLSDLVIRRQESAGQPDCRQDKSHERMRTNERLISDTLPVPAIPMSAANSARRMSMTRTTPRCLQHASPQRYGLRPEHRTPQRRQRERFEDIGAAPETAIHQNWNLPAGGLHAFGQRLDGRADLIQLLRSVDSTR